VGKRTHRARGGRNALSLYEWGKKKIGQKKEVSMKKKNAPHWAWGGKGMGKEWGESIRKKAITQQSGGGGEGQSWLHKG